MEPNQAPGTTNQHLPTSFFGGFSSSLQSLQEHQNAPPFQLITPPATRAEPLPQHGHEFRKGLPSANPT